MTFGPKLTSISRHSDDLPQRSHPVVKVDLRAAHQNDGAAFMVGCGACRKAVAINPANTLVKFLSKTDLYQTPQKRKSLTNQLLLLVLLVKKFVGAFILSFIGRTTLPGARLHIPPKNTLFFCARSNESCCLLMKQTLQNSTTQTSSLLTWDDLEQVLPRVVRVQRDLVDFAEAHMDDPLQRHKQRTHFTPVSLV